MHNKNPTKSTALPAPVELTPEDLARADKEAAEWRKAVQVGTESLEKVFVNLSKPSLY